MTLKARNLKKFGDVTVKLIYFFSRFDLVYCRFKMPRLENVYYFNLQPVLVLSIPVPQTNMVAPL